MPIAARCLAVLLIWPLLTVVVTVLVTWAGAARASEGRPGAAPALQRITVQLSWVHQTEFAGFYLAQRSGHFAREGLDVVLEPGSAAANPIDALHDGRADVAISSLRGALARSDARRPVTNVAQIFQTSPFVVMCRPSLGVAQAQDMHGKKVGAAGGGDVEVLKEMLRTLRPGGAQVELVPRDGTGRVLIQGEASCITGVTFNELLRVQNAGVPPSDLLILRPETFGVRDFGDGLYVKGERLESEAFRHQLAGLLRALAKGWRDAREHPSLAVAATLERNPALDTQFQYQALEHVLDLIAPAEFGLLRLDQLDAMAATLAAGPGGSGMPAYAWTHRVWNEWQRADGTAQRMTPATRHTLQGIVRHPLFFWLVTVGTLMFGLGGALLAIERGYNVWGRLLMAVLPAIGGGAVRDLLIGGPRLPLYFIADPTIPTALLGIVLVASALVAIFPGLPRTKAFAGTMRYSDAIGSAVIATNGAIVALLAGVPWVWVPVFAAISCAGGGLLQDIVTRQHPRALRRRVFEDEERGAISGLVLLGALWVANREDDPFAVYLGVVLAVVLNLGVRYARRPLSRIYPAWLTARPDPPPDPGPSRNPGP
jgi:uncharacterized membrane protein YeiH/ABC-type nitrate/sulfonate/bicarbonate transport system substrate-binding protein